MSSRCSTLLACGACGRSRALLGRTSLLGGAGLLRSPGGLGLLVGLCGEEHGAVLGHGLVHAAKAADGLTDGTNLLAEGVVPPVLPHVAHRAVGTGDDGQALHLGGAQALGEDAGDALGALGHAVGERDAVYVGLGDVEVVGIGVGAGLPCGPGAGVVRVGRRRRAVVGRHRVARRLVLRCGGSLRLLGASPLGRVSTLRSRSLLGSGRRDVVGTDAGDELGCRGRAGRTCLAGGGNTLDADVAGLLPGARGGDPRGVAGRVRLLGRGDELSRRLRAHLGLAGPGTRDAGLSGRSLGLGLPLLHGLGVGELLVGGAGGLVGARLGLAGLELRGAGLSGVGGMLGDGLLGALALTAGLGSVGHDGRRAARHGSADEAAERKGDAGLRQRDVMAKDRERAGARGRGPRGGSGQAGIDGRVGVPARHVQTPPL